MIWRKNFEFRIVLSGEPPPPVKIISHSYRSLSSVQESVHGFITQFQKGIFYALELLKSPAM